MFTPDKGGSPALPPALSRRRDTDASKGNAFVVTDHPDATLLRLASNSPMPGDDTRPILCLTTARSLGRPRRRKRR
jgi:hypothetical protein